MALLDAPDLFGRTIFCDDIRTEADGKISYIGSYGGYMFVHGPFPFTLPKFGLGIVFAQRKSLFVPNVGLRVFLPGDTEDAPSLVADLQEVAEGATAIAASAASPLPASDQSYVHLMANIILAPLVLKEPGPMKVRAVRGEDMIRLGTLTILPSQQQSAVAVPAEENQSSAA